MKKQINLTEATLNSMILEAIKKKMNEYYDPETDQYFDDDDQTEAGLSKDDPIYEDDDPAGMPDTTNDMDSDEFMRREGTVMELCNTWFPDEAAMEDFLLQLGELLDMPDEMEEILARLDDVEEEEEKMTGF